MISIIAAIGKNRELGRGNDLIWHIKEDLKNFKNLTMGKYIVMGKNTYESLPKHLEGRKYIVLSSSLSEIENGLLFNDFNKLLVFIKDVDEEVIIIGGASIYKLFLPFADKLYLTEIDSEEKADVYFPDFNKEDYECNVVSTNEVDGLKYSFVIYERK
ncbi:MAG: dihydrofolate reductase [Firmicutes bacterium]|jgi:dihydrofolate reductase|nr:dihydrofolate reductase [Bacillota bacterium]